MRSMKWGDGMKLITNLYDHQRKAVEKLERITIGALYMEQGTGKTRTALELIKKRLDAGKVGKVLWLCPCSVKENLRRDLLKHCSDISMITICGIETLSSSIRVNSELLDMVQNNKVYLIVDESNLAKHHKACRILQVQAHTQRNTYKQVRKRPVFAVVHSRLANTWVQILLELRGESP